MLLIKEEYFLPPEPIQGNWIDHKYLIRKVVYMIRMFRSKDRTEAIEFPDGEMSRVTEIAKFTGLTCDCRGKSGWKCC